MKLVSASMLSANFGKLEQEAKLLEEAGVDFLHMDIMDGRFVPNITMGPDIVQAIKNVSKVPIDTHLMILEPEIWIEKFAKAGSSIITFHYEATSNPRELIQKIKSYGVKAGISIKPATAISKINDLLDICDLVLVMSVNPGFSGQSFMAEQISKVEELKNTKVEEGYNFLIEVDGGVSDVNAANIFARGADIVVSGSYIFSGEYKEKIKVLKS